MKRSTESKRAVRVFALAAALAALSGCLVPGHFEAGMIGRITVSR